jgi:branched-chain amino acid aminotransferase
MKHEAIMSGFDDALALDEYGHVTEGTVSNVFLVRDNKLMTADNSSDLLEGITRDTIFSLCERLELKYEKRAIDRSELYLADEIFLCGSSVQITPVTEIDHRPIGDGRVGKITKQLMVIYAGIIQNTKQYKDWLTPVGMLK